MIVRMSFARRAGVLLHRTAGVLLFQSSLGLLVLVLLYSYFRDDLGRLVSPDDPSVVPGPSGCLTAYEKTVLEIPVGILVAVSDDTPVWRGAAPGRVEVYLEKDFLGMYYPRDRVAEEIRRECGRLGCARKAEAGAVALARYGDWVIHGQRSATVRLLVRVADDARVEKRPGLSVWSLERPVLAAGWQPVPSVPDPDRTAAGRTQETP
jgi:hypothetical protein